MSLKRTTATIPEFLIHVRIKSKNKCLSTMQNVIYWNAGGIAKLYILKLLV